jgi:sodium/pantothenate symporter
MTTMATYTSISSFISGPGAAGATYGYAQVWIAAVQVPVTFLVLGVLGNKLALVSRQTGAVTIVGYLNARYKSDALVIVISLLTVVFCTAQMIGQFTGGATLISSITGLPYGWALLIFGIVVIIYTSFGGFSAVAITDTFQGFIMCIGTFLLLFYVLKAGGGLSGVDAGLQRNLPGVYDNMFALYSPGALASFWILVGFGTLGLPQTAVRGMGFKDTKSLKSAMVIGCITCSFIMVGMHLAGCWAGGLVNKTSIPTSDYFIPAIVQQIMPVGVAGIFLAAPMAAVMSTADSLLILVSSAIIKDLWKTFFVKDSRERLARYNRHMKTGSALITLGFGVFVMLLSLDPPNIIFFLNLFAFGGLECSFLWPLVGGLFWKKGTKEAALASSIGAVATYIFCYYNVKVAGINAVVWGLLAGGILYFAVGAVTSAKRGLDPEILDKCF